MVTRILSHYLVKFVLALLLTAGAVRANPEQAGCSFTLTSSGGIACPAGQLDDGQIRLNGSYDAATFYIADGKITDSEGRGCLITGPPETQFQCDLNKAPAGGFAIDSSNTLTYNGSPNFYACPATDTEYNIYVHPDFGQEKCVPITLTASGCGTAPPPPPPSTSCNPSTVLQTTTVTVMVTTPVEVTVSTCSPSSTSKTRQCNKCTKKTTTTTTTTFPSSWTTMPSSGTGCNKCTHGGNSTGRWNTSTPTSWSWTSSGVTLTDVTADPSATETGEPTEGADLDPETTESIEDF